MKVWASKDNTDHGEKTALRRRLLAEIPAPSVLDCYAGSGEVWRHCYQGLPYLGLDRKPTAATPERPVLRADNRAFLRRVDLSPYNVFDLDAYGSPWHPFFIIFERRKIAPGERVAFALTDGLQFKLSMSDCPSGFRPYVGLPAGMKIPCLGRHQDFLCALVVVSAVRRGGARVVLSLRGTNPRGNMRYLGLVVEGEREKQP